MGAARDLDADGERFLDVVHVRDDEYALEAILDRLDDLQDAVSAVGVLRAESLVDEERGQRRAGAPRKHLAQRDAHREVDAEALAAAEQFVGA